MWTPTFRNISISIMVDTNVFILTRIEILNKLINAVQVEPSTFTFGSRLLASLG